MNAGEVKEGCFKDIDRGSLIAVIPSSYFGQTPAVKVRTLEKPRRS
jgi:hypothetical protein